MRIGSAALIVMPLKVVALAIAVLRGEQATLRIDEVVGKKTSVDVLVTGHTLD